MQDELERFNKSQADAEQVIEEIGNRLAFAREKHHNNDKITDEITKYTLLGAMFIHKYKDTSGAFLVSGRTFMEDVKWGLDRVMRHSNSDVVRKRVLKFVGAFEDGTSETMLSDRERKARLEVVDAIFTKELPTSGASRGRARILLAGHPQTPELQLLKAQLWSIIGTEE